MIRPTPAPGSDGYGLGVYVWQVRGETMIGHTGQIPGFASVVGYLPRLDITVVALGNNDSFDARIAGRRLAAIVLGKPYPDVDDGVVNPGCRQQYREAVLPHRFKLTGVAQRVVGSVAGEPALGDRRVRMEMEAAAGDPVWSGVLLDRNGHKTVVPVATGERTDSASGQRWLTADITLAPPGAGDYVVELTAASGAEQKKTLVGIRVER
jgi:hypothetical protein